MDQKRVDKILGPDFWVPHFETCHLYPTYSIDSVVVRYSTWTLKKLNDLLLKICAVSRSCEYIEYRACRYINICTAATYTYSEVLYIYIYVYDLHIYTRRVYIYSHRIWESYYIMYRICHSWTVKSGWSQIASNLQNYTILWPEMAPSPSIHQPTGFFQPTRFP